MANINRAYGESVGSRSAKSGRKVASPSDPSADKPKRGQKDQDDQYLSELIQTLVDDDMGYLKLRRGLDTSLLHLTWTWASGPHHGFYVYACVSYWELQEGLQLVLVKRNEVYEGVRRPTPDKRRSSID